MDFNSFLTQVSKLKTAPLGGIDSQFKMVPELRLRFDQESIARRQPKESAVLALFYPDQEAQTRFLLTLRASYNGTHASQISFPGGKKDKVDNNLEHTALRETYEEVGVSKNEITVVRELTKTYIPPSNFWVTPYMGYVGQEPVFNTNKEVAQLIEVSCSDLLNDKSLVTKILNTSYMTNTEVPCFVLNDHIVWGATAMILSEIKDLLKTS